MGQEEYMLEKEDFEKIDSYLRFKEKCIQKNIIDINEIIKLWMASSSEC